MRRFVSSWIFLFSGAAIAASQPPLPPVPLPPPVKLAPVSVHQDFSPVVPPGGFQLDFQQINLGNLITLAYTDVIKRNFALDSSLASRNDLVSVVFASKKPADILPVLRVLVEGVGGEVINRDGIDVYRLKTGNESADWQIYSYTPRYQSAQALISQVQGLVTGKFSQQSVGGSAAPTGMQTTGTGTNQTTSVSSVSSQSEQHDLSSVIIFQGLPEEHKKFLDLMSHIDIPQENFDVDAAIYEVQGLRENETALSGLVKIAGLNLNLGAPAVSGGSVATLGPNAFSVTASALRNNSQYKLLSQPHIRVRSGESGNIVITTQTQIDTGSVMAQNGTTQQSLTYQSAGLNFTVALNGRRDVINANVSAQYSDFGSTGSTGAPDILQRQLTTSFDTIDGETIALGGMREQKDTSASSGLPFLPWNLGKSDSSTSTEFLIVMTVHRHDEMVK